MSEFTPPPAGLWEQIAQIRESQARTETNVARLLERDGLVDAKQNEHELRLYALEQHKNAYVSEVQAVDAKVKTVRDTIDAYDITPSAFKTWREKVDSVVTGFNNSQQAVLVRRNLRKGDLAWLGAFTTLGMFLVKLPDVIRALGGG